MRAKRASGHVKRAQATTKRGVSADKALRRGRVGGNTPSDAHHGDSKRAVLHKLANGGRLFAVVRLEGATGVLDCNEFKHVDQRVLTQVRKALK